MKPAVSNISLPDAWDQKALAELAALGFAGLEIAPSKLFSDTWNIAPADISRQRKLLASLDLECVGLHSLFYDRPELGLFVRERDRDTIRFLVQLAHVCADLGGAVMVMGSPSARCLNGISVGEADKRAAEILNEVGSRTAEVGVSLLIEPLPEKECEYIHSLHHAMKVVKMADSPGIAAHFDAKSMFAASEYEEGILRKALPWVRHCHVNETDLGALRSRAEIHRPLGTLLRSVGYDGWISLEQRMVDESDIFGPLRQSMDIIREYYL